MKKINRKILTLSLTCITLASCNSNKTVIPFDSQLDAVVQLNNGTVDAVVIDSVMAGYYASTGEFANKIAIIDDLVLSEEEYGIAGRKDDQAFIDKINEGLIGTYLNGSLNDIASFFGVTKSLIIDASTTYNGVASDNSWNKICESNKIVIGYTVFAPIAYEDDNSYSSDKFTGFDTELARSVVSYLNEKYEKNIAVEFEEIDWDSKETLLKNGTIDLIWNGLTITEERKTNMCMSIPYLKNFQAVVTKKEDATKYNSVDSLIKANVGVESGSAGEEIIKEIKGIK